MGTHGKKENKPKISAKTRPVRRKLHQKPNQKPNTRTARRAEKTMVRLNLGNYENGEKMSTSCWKKHISRHCQSWTKLEMIAVYKNSKEAMQAIDAYFSPYLDGECVKKISEDGESEEILGRVISNTHGFLAVTITGESFQEKTQKAALKHFL